MSAATHEGARPAERRDVQSGVVAQPGNYGGTWPWRDVGCADRIRVIPYDPTSLTTTTQ
jgi:hypothetical protein